ncbi:type VI secretion system Vgr family protein [uncultured Variovorax sp.]|uniref:type VI secretion system Vgr family protein n=1 Tax=uncultured Variovorax sp. TaxID=114708 RepID=UPI0025D088C0|nr:type VI secretion system Vgr family protein [uncultured Variovorax sp.]
MTKPTLAGRRVTIATPIGEALQFHRLVGREALSSAYAFDVELLGRSNTIDPKALLGKTATVSMQTAHGVTRHLAGIVTRFGLAREDARQCFYALRLRPWFWLATKRHDYRIFQDRSVPEIVAEVLGRYGHPFEQKLTRGYRVWNYCVQYGESDFDFVSRLCEHEGIHYWFRHEAAQHVLVFADDIAGSHGPLPGGETVRYHPHEMSGMTGGKEPAERIYAWEMAEDLRSGRHCTDDYDFEKPRADLRSRREMPSGHDNDSHEVFEWPGHYLLNADGDTYAHIRNEEQSSGRCLVSGRSNLRSLAPGHTMRLAGHPRDDQNRQYLVLGVAYHLQENLRASEGTDAAAGGSIQRFAFDAQPTSFAWRSPRTTPRPRTGGPQTAVVVGPAGHEIWTDQHGRIKVQFQWDRLGGNDENSSCWLRVAHGWAGVQFGTAALPRIGQEVLVDFLNGNPDHPVVVGRFHNADKMPAWKLPAQTHLTGIRSRELGGGLRGNHLAFDDSTNKVQAQLKSDHQCSSISLGHIGRIDDTAGRKDDRGQGFELRTDGHGALRAARGLLVSTEPRPNAQAHITDMGETVARLTQAREVHEGMSQLALDARAHENGDQKEVAAELKRQNDTIQGKGIHAAQDEFPEFVQPHLMLASPSGIQTTAQGSSHFASAGHNALTSGGHTSVVTARSFLVSAKNAVRMFAYRAGMKLVAGNADIDIAALRNSISVLAKMNIRLEANRIMITAAEEVVINGGSSYTCWNAAGIVSGTLGTWRAHSARHSFIGPDSRTPDKMNRDAQTRFDQEVLFHRTDEEDTPAARQLFELTRNSESAAMPASGKARTQEAPAGEITSSDGTTRQQRSDGPESYKVAWLGRAS